MTIKQKRAFPNHSAHDVHPGREGGNKINRAAGIKIGADLLEHLKAGAIEVRKVEPPLKEGDTFDLLQGKFASGDYVLTGVESTDVAHDGEKRAQRAKLFYHKAASPDEARTLEVEWVLPD